MKTNILKLKEIADEVRQDVVAMLAEAGSGHSAGSLGMADVYTALYFSAMKHNPKNTKMKNRDRFIISNGHICPVWYAVLARAGYFKTSELKTLRKFGTRLQGHPHMGAAPGIDNSAGPLGQGISIAIGVAIAARMNKENHKVYCSMGDGELDEGQCWEGFMFAGKEKLNNLIVFVDRNYIQIDGMTNDVMPLDPLDKKFQSFGWNVIKCDGNNMDKIVGAFNKAKKSKKKPVVILAKTVPGKGVSFIEGKFEWHGKPPTKEQAEIAISEIKVHESKLKGMECKGCKKPHEICECAEGQ